MSNKIFKFNHQLLRETICNEILAKEVYCTATGGESIIKLYTIKKFSFIVINVYVRWSYFIVLTLDNLYENTITSNNNNTSGCEGHEGTYKTSCVICLITLSFCYIWLSVAKFNDKAFIVRRYTWHCHMTSNNYTTLYTYTLCTVTKSDTLLATILRIL